MRISDCSSDVCSSDLFVDGADHGKQGKKREPGKGKHHEEDSGDDGEEPASAFIPGDADKEIVERFHSSFGCVRSEERRVGKEGGSTCRSRWSPSHQNTNNQINQTKYLINVT